MNDRIRLAEAMGLEVVAVATTPALNRVSVRYPDAEHGVNFDPFTNANDDYAVLEWMRSHDKPVSRKKVIEFDAALGDEDAWLYMVGDYARAALKVIDERG